MPVPTLTPGDWLAIERELSARSLVDFLKLSWPVLEPGQPYVHGWHMDAMAEHLHAVADGRISRLIINIPPGTSKSTLCSVIFPAWLWGPRSKPSTRILSASHEQGLAVRDNLKTRRLIESEWFCQRWPTVRLTTDQNEKTYFENSATGFRQATAVASMTGRRGDIVIWDDPHSPEKAYSDATRETAIRVFTETLPTRLNNPATSAIIIVMQRLHERDVTGYAIAHELGYEHLCMPMEFDPSRRCVTSIGWMDPRKVEGELLFPARFPREVVDRDKQVMGEFAVAGQFQQRPAPRGGGIIRRDWWKLWPANKKLPAFDHVVMSLDTAFTEKSTADYSACSVWGFFEQKNGTPAALLLDAWQERYSLPDLIARVKEEMQCVYGGEETIPLYTAQIGPPKWSVSTGRKVDTIVIEDKGSGISLRQMLQREGIFARPYNPGRADKVTRLHNVSHIFAGGVVYVPEDENPIRAGYPDRWADDLISQVCGFSGPGSLAHDDYVDSATQALRYFIDYHSVVMSNPIDDDELPLPRRETVSPYGA